MVLDSAAIGLNSKCDNFDWTARLSYLHRNQPTGPLISPTVLRVAGVAIGLVSLLFAKVAVGYVLAAKVVPVLQMTALTCLTAKIASYLFRQAFELTPEGQLARELQVLADLKFRVDDNQITDYKTLRGELELERVYLNPEALDYLFFHKEPDVTFAEFVSLHGVYALSHLTSRRQNAMRQKFIQECVLKHTGGSLTIRTEYPLECTHLGIDTDTEIFKAIRERESKLPFNEFVERNGKQALLNLEMNDPETKRLIREYLVEDYLPNGSNNGNSLFDGLVKQGLIVEDQKGLVEAGIEERQKIIARYREQVRAEGEMLEQQKRAIERDLTQDLLEPSASLELKREDLRTLERNFESQRAKFAGLESLKAALKELHGTPNTPSSKTHPQKVRERERLLKSILQAEPFRYIPEGTTVAPIAKGFLWKEQVSRLEELLQKRIAATKDLDAFATNEKEIRKEILRLRTFVGCIKGNYLFNPEQVEKYQQYIELVGQPFFPANLDSTKIQTRIDEVTEEMAQAEESKELGEVALLNINKEIDGLEKRVGELRQPAKGKVDKINAAIRNLSNPEGTLYLQHVERLRSFMDQFSRDLVDLETE